jgi:Cellulase (glycosyl hydrolase family 5)
MWSRYDRQVISEELAALASLGCTLTRSFCYWPDFMPAPETLDDEVMARFIDFLDLHLEAGLQTIPTFIVGHMSGANWDPSWRGERDLYRDVWFVSQQAWFVAEVARRSATHPAIAAWLLSNEMPIYGRNGDEKVVTSWARLLVQALRSAGAAQPVSTGDGAWGIEVTGNDNGFSLRRLAPIVDFVGPHVYPSSDDAVRQMLSAAFACELSGSFGKPVVLEEFGLSSDLVSGQNAAHYYRQVLHSTLLAGARGWLAWNNCDYDNLVDQEPYRHHPFEMHFGITDRAGQPKPQALELARFSALVAELSSTGWERHSGEVALVVPEHFEHTEEPWSPIYRGDIRLNLFQSYIAALEADLPVAIVRERDLLEQGASVAGGAKLYLLPCAQLVMAPTIPLMVDFARRGATVYASYFAGRGRHQTGPWMPWLQETFGVAHRLRYGVADVVEPDEVQFELVDDVGELAKGTELSFAVGGEGTARAYLPVEPAGADVLAVDARGMPALLRNRTGDGWMVLCTYPLEHMAASTPAANPEPTWQLYSALASISGVNRPLRVNDPRITVGSLRVGQKDAFLALNLSPVSLEAQLVAPGSSIYLTSSSGDQSIDSLSLEPYEVALLYRLAK